MQNGSSAFSTWEQSCVEIDTSVVSALTDNSNEVFKNAVDVLLKLMNNILKDPYSIKYRRIRLSNPKIESMLLGQCYISIKIYVFTEWYYKKPVCLNQYCNVLRMWLMKFSIYFKNCYLKGRLHF